MARAYSEKTRQRFPETRRQRAQPLLTVQLQQHVPHPRTKARCHAPRKTQLHTLLFDAPALLTTGTGTFEVHVLDLSLKGALVEVPDGLTLPSGAPCQLMVPLAATEKHIAMSAEVAHVGGLHLGMLCCSMDLDSVTHLRRLIELQLDDPALLERDLSALIAAGAHAPGAGA